MNFKHYLFYVGLSLFVAEIIILSIMPSVNTGDTLNDSAQAGAYVPYMFFALTLAFASATLFLISSIFFILKGTIRKNIPTMAALALSFLVPVLVYLILT